jgi:hypothetical protein
MWKKCGLKWELVVCSSVLDILERIMFRDPVFVSLIKPSDFSFKGLYGRSED